MEEESKQQAAVAQGEVSQAETPQPVVPAVELSADTLKQQITEREQKIKALEQTINKQGQENRKLRETSTLIAALNKKQEDQEGKLATMLDYLEEIRGGVPAEAQPQIGRHQAELEQRRKETSKPLPSVDDDVREFTKYCTKHGIDEDHPLWTEAVIGSTSPAEALERLKPKVEAIEQEEVQKRDKAAEEKARILLQQELKKLGLTGSDASGPNVAGSSTFTRKQITEMSLEDYVRNKPAIDAAVRAGRIK